MEKNNSRSIVIEYIAMYLLIAVSGIPFFLFGVVGSIVVLIINILFIITLILNNKIKMTSKAINFMVACVLMFLLLFIIQAFGCGFFPFINFQRYAIRVLLAGTAVVILWEHFFELYIKTITALGIISLIIHVASFVIPPFFDFCINVIVPHIPNQVDDTLQIFHNYHIIIHDFWQHDLFRNSGPFWEPGANAGFTLLALFFNMYIFREKVLSKRNLLLITVILSTISTAGYVVLVVVLFLNPQYEKKVIARALSLVLIFAVAIWALNTFEFIGVKVLQQIDNTSVGDAHTSRFASARLDYETFLIHPLGFSNIDYRKGVKEEQDFRSNGVFIFLTAVGAVAFFIYFFWVFRSMRAVFKYFNSSSKPSLIALYFMLIIIFMGFSENFFERPLFLLFSLMFPFFAPVTLRRYQKKINQPVLMEN